MPVTLSICDTEAGGSQIQNQPQLPSKNLSLKREEEGGRGGREGRGGDNDDDDDDSLIGTIKFYPLHISFSGALNIYLLSIVLTYFIFLDEVKVELPECQVYVN